MSTKGFRNPEDKEAPLAVEERGKVMGSFTEDALSQGFLGKKVPGRGNSMSKVERCVWRTVCGPCC